MRPRGSRTSRPAVGQGQPLIGYGLVVGLQGTGDSLRSSPFTDQSIRAMLAEPRHFHAGRRVVARATSPAVLVTATAPPFASPGSRLDVTVGSLGMRRRCAGGTLVMTSLSGADGPDLRVAQGSVVVSGFNARSEAAQLSQGVTTAGRVPNGAIIERNCPSKFKDGFNPGAAAAQPGTFPTAVGMAAADQ